MNAKATVMACTALATLVAGTCAAEVSFDAGADLRIRQEIMDNIPGMPGGGLLLAAPRSGYRNQMRYRPRVWGEVKASENWRLYMRLTDEFRWTQRPVNAGTKASRFPDELILDNLFIEAKDLFDGFLDFTAGRQDIYNLYGLDHVFVDGTPGDGSRTADCQPRRASFFVISPIWMQNSPLTWKRKKFSRRTPISGESPMNLYPLTSYVRFEGRSKISSQRFFVP